MNKFQWNFNQNTKFLIHENTSESIVCEMAAILARGRWVNVFINRLRLAQTIWDVTLSDKPTKMNEKQTALLVLSLHWCANYWQNQCLRGVNFDTYRPYSTVGSRLLGCGLIHTSRNIPWHLITYPCCRSVSDCSIYIQNNVLCFSDVCENTVGSYRCLCSIPGYVIDEYDRHKCRGQ